MTFAEGECERPGVIDTHKYAGGVMHLVETQNGAWHRFAL